MQCILSLTLTLIAPVSYRYKALKSLSSHRMRHFTTSHKGCNTNTSLYWVEDKDKDEDEDETEAEAEAEQQLEARC